MEFGGKVLCLVSEAKEMTGFDSRGKTKMRTFHTDLCNLEGRDGSSSDVVIGEMLLNHTLRLKGNSDKTEEK